jgi:hypothetical protein
MKKKKIICLFCFVLGMVLVYYLGYTIGKKYNNTNAVTREWVYENNPAVYSTEEGKEAANTSELIVSNSMSYILESYNINDKTIETAAQNVPSEFLGMNRQELIDYLKANKKKFADKGQQVQNIMLVSMEKDKLVIRKSISIIEETTEEEKCKYYVTLQENKIIVYREDKTTIFLETSINVETLDTDSMDKLKQGIPVKNISELYRILESFTT